MVAALAVLAVLAALTAGCSPTSYPAVLAAPTPRDPVMNDDQIKQATDSLLSDRTQLSTQVQQAQAGAQAITNTMPPPPPPPPTTQTPGYAAKP